MKQGVLISSLGESPAVITETIDALEREGIKLKWVVTIGTSNWKVNLSEELLQREFREYYQNRIAYYPDRIEAEELISQSDHIKFLKKVASKIRNYRYYADVYLSLAGGRKTMSAIMMLAAQIYGAKLLCHVIVKEEIEELGRIEKIFDLSLEEQRKILHPSPDEVQLVQLPFINLMSMVDDFIKILKEEKTANKEAIRLLKESGMLTESLKPTDEGKIFLDILQDVEKLPLPNITDRKIHISDHGYSGKRKEVEELAERLADFPWTKEVRTISYNPTPRTKVGEIYDDGRIKVYINFGNFGVGFELKTTATNKGETERVAKELENYLQKMK